MINGGVSIKKGNRIKEKITSCALSASLLVGLALPTVVMIPQASWAQEQTLTQEQAIKIATSIMGLPSGLKNTQASLREDDQMGRKVWDLNWEISSYRNYHGYQIQLDAVTGEVVNYSENVDWKSSINPVKVKGKAECQKIAENFLKKITPAHFKETRLAETPFNDFSTGGPRVRNYRYERMVNGIPLSENYLVVSVNAETGIVMNYYLSWNDSLTFPDPTSVVPAEQAAEIFRTKIGLHLAYSSSISPYFELITQNNQPVELYYSQNDGLNYQPIFVDALTGKTLNYLGQEVTVKQQVYLSSLPELPQQPSGKTLTLEEAKAKLANLSIIPANYELQSTDSNRNGGFSRAQTWNFQYQDTNSLYGRGLSASIDAKTGELVQFNDWNGFRDDGQVKPQKYDYAQCRRLALDFVKKYCPQKLDYLQPNENHFPGNQIYYLNGKAMKSSPSRPSPKSTANASPAG